MCFPASFHATRDHGRAGRKGVRPLVASVLVLALTACGSDTEPVADRVVDDSAGVRIVTLAATPDVEAPFAFGPEPLYRHGAGADDYMFSSVWRGILLGDGSAAIFDARNSELVLLNPDGTFHSVLAPAGEGPGEVKMVTSMFAAGRDGILVEDFLNARFTLFVNGAVARTVSTRGPINDGLRSRGMDASGGMLMSSGSYRRGFPEEWLPGHMVRFDLDTGVADTVATYDYVPFHPPEGTPENPFKHFGIAGAVGGEFLYGRTDTPELVWRRPDGSVRQIVRREPDPVYPAEEHWDIFAAELRETAPRHNPHAQTEEAIEELVTSMLGRYELEPDVPLPLFTTPRGDDEGRIWLGDFVVGYGGTITSSYRILSAEGEWLGRLDVPDGLRILDIAGGRVLGVMKDEMEVESAVVFELAEAG
ncbi:MAG: hypothetical protein OXQ94_17895 [Gemmatimonadota bacterium]|nr:hypothetical protein [Gemmatimonadota bacterium]